MKKRYLTLVFAAAVAGSLVTGCGSASKSETTETASETVADETETAGETAGDEAEEMIPADFIQERAGKDLFDSYDEVISYLDGENEGFAYIQVAGSTEYVLAVSDQVSAENGTSTDVSLYAYNDDNKLINVGNAFGDENHPLLSDGNTLYTCTDTEYGEMQINSESNGLTYIKCIDKTDSGEFSGFVRENANSDSTEDIGVETEEQFKALFDAISDVPAIKFNAAQYESYEDIISKLSVKEGYAYITLNGYDGDILAVCSDTYEDDGINCAIDATMYVENDGKAELLASVQTGGTAYPITADGGIFYYKTPVKYAEADVTKNDDGKYQLNYIKYAAVSYDTDGNASFDVKGDIKASDIKTEDDFYNLYTGSEEKAKVNFTVKK